MKMNTVKKRLEFENQNAVINATQAKTAYVKPTIEVIEMEMEGPILSGSGNGSNFGNGGYYERGYERD